MEAQEYEIQCSPPTQTPWIGYEVQQHNQYVASMTDHLAAPIAATWCVSELLILGFILVLAAIRSAERRNRDDNAANIEECKITWAGKAERAKHESEQPEPPQE